MLPCIFALINSYGRVIMKSDIHASLNEVKALYVEGKDFRILSMQRQDWLTVIAPHGGYVEPGTSKLAASLAGKKHQLFDFQCLSPALGFSLHVTSTNFRDDRLDMLLKSSQAAISIHCMGPTGHAEIWLGGRNRTFKLEVLRALSSSRFEVNPNAPRYRGESPRNVVNLVPAGGVQLELSAELMYQLFPADLFHPRQGVAITPLFKRLVRSLRTGIRRYQAHLDLDKQQPAD